MKDGKLVLRLTRSWPESRVLRLSLAGNYASPDRETLSALSLDNDACGPPVRHGASAAGKSAGAWAQECADRLKGKVYRYDALVQQLTDRAKAVLIEQIRDAHPELTVQFKR